MIKLLKLFCMISVLFNLLINAQENYCTKVIINDSTEVSLYTASMIRVRISKLPGEKFPSKYEIPFLIGKTDNWKKVKYKIEETVSYKDITTSKIIFRFNKLNGNWKIFNKDNNNQIHPSDEPNYGMFKNGYSLFDNASFFNEKNQNSRYSHWFYHKETKSYTDVFLEEDLIRDQYFIYGPDYEEIFKQFNELVGREPLLPIKAYGFYQTQHLACEGTQEKLLKVANKFRERNIPCDNLIIDFEWGDGCEKNKEIVWGSSMKWNKNYSVPLSPKQFIDSLHNLNYDVMLIHHNAPNYKSRKWQGWTETVFDEKEWFANYFNELNLGINGTWQDTRRNDITDGLIWNKTQSFLGEDNRVLFMGCRRMQMINPWDDSFTVKPYNNLIGSRRYPFDWTGDCSYSWAELAWQINAITNEHGSMKGINYISSDGIGANWKIQARWLQFSAFTAIARSHNPKPWQGNVNIKDFVNKIQIRGRDTLSIKSSNLTLDSKENAEESIKKYLNLRYKLLPYIYTYARINYDTGFPICRPMMLAFQEDFRCAMNQWPYQFMFGEEFLVAPVYGDFNTMEIYLPKDENWIDYWSGEVFKGGGILRYDVSDVNKLPLFVKEGSIIPMENEKEWITKGEIPNTIFLNIYAGKDCEFLLYDDDRKSINYQDEEYGFTKIEIKKEREKSEIIINKMVGEFDNKPQSRDYRFSIMNLKFIPSELILQSNERDIKISPREWKFNGIKKELVFTIEGKSTNEVHKITIK